MLESTGKPIQTEMRVKCRACCRNPSFVLALQDRNAYKSEAMNSKEEKDSQVENDRESRRRAIEETHRSFVVEASAGTGKTTTLIGRMLHLVLEKGPSGQPVPLSRICAITFTEKAAGEMKIRLRQSFEQVLSDSRSLADSLSRAQAALRDLETASISTFHSFAVSLLKERPIEAGLDPRFTALDEIRSELFFREVWESWISRVLSDRHPILERALRNGINLGVLKNVAGILRLNGPAVRTLRCNSPETEEQIQEKFQDLLQQGRILVGKIQEPNDKLLGYLEKAVDWLENPSQDRVPSKPGKAGSAANWSGGKETLQIVQEFVREVVEFRISYRQLPAQRLLSDVVRWILGDFIPEWESRKQARGFLDFDDQLWFARNLLLSSKSVRREFQTRFATLLVDEFQDTDPVQLEIVLLLSSTNLDESNPARLRPGPGRLFIVGDPKQSIYRFRNADIETYLEVVDPQNMHSLGLDRLQLTANFRSVPSILRFVDAAFKDLMKAPADGFYQPDYLPFGNEGNRTQEWHSPSVHLLGDVASETAVNRTVREFLESEAVRIARLICRMCDSDAWKIQDPREKKNGSWRMPRFGDIAILLPVLSRAEILEEALRDMEIPYVLEGGKFYYARSEVSSAITVLRAIANPNDCVTLYGALRSIFFGFSDEDLLRAHFEGQRLDYRAEVPAQSLFFRPFEILRDLHRNRHERRASETLETLLQKTGAREVLAVRGLQSLANLNKLVRTLRTLQEEATFSQVVDLLATMDEEGLAESESRLMEERSNAVRILSIHKSKGLDFPIVLVANLGLQKRTQNKSLLADFHREKIFGLSIGSQESGLQTPGWKELVEEERKRENAELLRLLYVGLTRARDHLILCTHTQNWKMLEDSGRQIPDMGKTRLRPLSSFLEHCLSEDNDLVRWVDTKSLDAFSRPRQTALLPETTDCRAIVEREYRELHALLDNTPFSRNLQAAGQAENKTGQAEERAPDDVENRAVRLGSAFHAAMEGADLLRQEDVTVRMQELSVRYKLDRESIAALEDMMRRCLASDLIERARRAIRSGRRLLRELPFVRSIGGATIEEGKIDLLFEEEDGWVLVDYKTDWVSNNKEAADTFFHNTYASQIREYRVALQNLSTRVTSAYLLLARTGDAIKMF
jgi:ATP-dependent helicase/nuclease subunit A